MENSGLSQEIEELFSTVAVDLGWLGNIEDAQKDLELEIAKNVNKTSKVKGKSKAKVKKKKKEKKVFESGDSTSHKGNRSKVKDPICSARDVDLSSAKTFEKHGANLSSCSQDKDVDLTDIDNVQKTSPERCQKGFKETIPNRTTAAGDVNSCYSVHDLSVTYAIKDTDHGDAKSSDTGSYHQFIDEKQGVDKTDVDNCCNDEVKYGYTNHDSKDGCDVDFIQYKDATDTKYDSQNDFDNYDYNLNKNSSGLSDLSSGEDQSQGTSNKDIDPKQEETPPFLTLTERLMRNHKHKREKEKTSPDGHDKPQQSQNGSVEIKETVSSVSGEMDDSDSYHTAINEDAVLSFQDRSKLLMSDDGQCKHQSSVNAYRDAETPNRYASDSSSDDDDNFESFLASIKKSSQATTKTPPSQDEMDDFIVNDNDPILLSSDGEEAEEKEIFYYQCENAVTDLPNKGEKSVRKKDRSTSHKSRLEDSTNSEAGNCSTPVTHRHTSVRNMKTPNNSRTKRCPDINSLLSDSESENENAFATPMWRPSTIKTPTRLQSASNTTRKLYRSTKLTNGFGSDDSDGDNSVFATPVVRPPLKTKNPANTLPSKLHRPVKKDYHHKPHGLGTQSTPSFLTSLATPPMGEASSSPYVREFKQKKEALTSELFKLYNETVFDNKLPSDLSVTWNKRLRKTAGYCYYSKSKIGANRSSRVELSEKVCDSAERLRDTLIHELCHAAAWLINGVHDGHGRYWKYWAAKANIAHPEIPIIKRCHSYEINTKYKYQCTRCNTTIGRHSKSINTDKFCCAYCKGQLILLPTVNKDGTPARTRTPNKFAMFVKENYASTKKWNADMKHADIMRLLSKDFATKAKI